MYCPQCGQHLPQTKTTHNGWTAMQTLESSTALAIPTAPPAAAFTEAYRKTPFRKLEMGADVFVPLTQAVVSGVLTAMILAMLVPIVPQWSWGVPFVTGGMVIGLVWVVAMFKDRGLWIIEEIIGQDIDHDGHTGKPQVHTVALEVKEGNSRKMFNMPGDERDLARFCARVSAGDPFTESTAQECGYGITNLRKLRTLFINSRWAFWKNPDAPQQGIELTLSGKQVIEQLAQELDITISPTPLPQAENVTP